MSEQIKRDDILECYKRNNAYLSGHFLLSSGLHSDTYLQSALLMQFPGVASQIVRFLADDIKGYNFDTVVSPAIGGLHFGYELARTMDKRCIFTERVDNVMTLRRGFTVTPGEKMVIAEDVVTTGKSTLECLNVVKDLGAEIVAIVSLVDRSNGTAFAGTQYENHFHSLVKLNPKAYKADECPMCKAGGTPVKPGSRKF